ncbi:MAG TPA: hypothetical protein VII76_02775 [Acidimicrobiales bacterium]
MTDGHLTGGHLTDGHLTDEQLSSHLDRPAAVIDETTASAWHEHLARCAPCRRRLATLEAVRARLRAPMAPTAPHGRAASIDRILRAAAEDGARDTPDTRDAPILIPRRRPQVLVGAAAAVLVLAVAIGVPLALADHGISGSAESTAAKAVRQPAGAVHNAQASGTTGPSGSATATVYDLGTVGSTGELRSRVAAIRPNDFSVPAPYGQAASSATSQANTTDTAGPGSIGTPSQFERCLSSAMSVAGSARLVHLLAIAAFKTTPTLVYVFAPDANGPVTGKAAGSLVVATALHGCKVVATTSL